MATAKYWACLWQECCALRCRRLLCHLFPVPLQCLCRILSDAKSANEPLFSLLVDIHYLYMIVDCRILSDAKSANERRMASCADLLITSTTMFWQLYPFK